MRADAARRRELDLGYDVGAPCLWWMSWSARMMRAVPRRVPRMWIGPSPMLSTAEVNPSFVRSPSSQHQDAARSLLVEVGEQRAALGADRALDHGPVGGVVSGHRASSGRPRLPSVCASARPLSTVTVAHERKASAVRRPGRPAVESRRGRRPPRSRPVERGDPHVGVAGDVACIGDDYPGLQDGDRRHRAHDESRGLAARRSTAHSP